MPAGAHVLETIYLVVGETERIEVDYTTTLRTCDNETISSVATADANGLTIGSPTVITTAKRIKDKPVEASRAWYYTVSGGTANGGNGSGLYEVVFTVTTSASRVLKVTQPIQWEAP